ncbi:hypothetical protein PPYR_00173 [Photinus pyralis]|uniref:BTB domain-containing protein n=1 Tax=Photinus pyralis TaxID=7054 RepID=A0A5N4B0X3_PHOPY|nr:inhibitor of Bruton tyrosine kinase [Photinus pyralis]KAB0803203.1 hypothetical protein PPYR_00173 [Photinus pyralis]
MSELLKLDERDCTDLCKSIQHADLICGALTKRQPLDCHICAYLQLLCCRCESVKDRLGRTALHIAASCGRSNVIKWLLKVKHANINAKDYESGYTPLHRSIFYGKIDVAVHLIKLGANFGITDFNGLTSLEHAMKDSWRTSGLREIKHGEVYVWGSNTNYTFGSQETRVNPELLYAFHKEYPNITVGHICLEKFHCLILTSDGKVYGCGHGQGGRLGLGSEGTVITPKQIKLAASGHANPVLCKKVSISIDHSIFLSQSGHVWTTGLNSYRVLGIQPPPTKSLIPVPLPLLPDTIEDVGAAKYHSIAWGSTAVYTWGLNAGQLGHEKTSDKYIIAPKLVSCTFGVDIKIKMVAVSNGATAVLTSKGDIYVLHEYHCRKILKNQLNLISISVIGGKLNEKLDNSLTEANHELKIVALSNVGNLYLWQSSSPQFARCIYSINRSLSIRQVTFNLNEILFVTNDGEAFKGIVKPRKIKMIENNLQIQKSDFHEFIDSGQLIKLSKIHHVHRALSISSDFKGRNYAVLQANPNTFVKRPPVVSPSVMKQDMFMFLHETAEDDAINDVIFRVSKRYFPAHRYIIASGGGKLLDVVNASQDLVVELVNIKPEIFQQLLMFIYTGTCDLLNSCKWEINSCECDQRERDTGNVCSGKDPVRLLQEAAKRFGLKGLQNMLNNVYYEDGCVYVKNTNVQVELRKFNRMSYPGLHDVVLKTKDGIEMQANICILSARLEYFNNLFSVRWNQDSRTKHITLPFPSAILLQLIEFLYTDELPLLRKEDVDHICQLLILADQLFVIRLKEICEHTLTSFVTLKNVAQMISFATIYNANQLKNYCMEFVCVNLSCILESKCLETLDDEELCDITNFYSTFHPIMECRVITPYSYAPSDEVLLEANKICEISFNEESISDKHASKTQKKRTRIRKTSTKEIAVNKEYDHFPTFSSPEKIELENIEEKQTIETYEIRRVKSRLKALEMAKEIVNCDNSMQEYTKLPLRHRTISITPMDFPELTKDYIPTSPTPKSSKVEKVEIKQKITKLSQKQRKRLSSESSVHSLDTSSANINLSESPRNPWKIPSPPLSSSPIEVSYATTAMHSIIDEERKQKQNFVKMKSKLLVHTQIEDKAIEELDKFYNAGNISDEIITIKRVQTGLIASPVWVK